MELLEHIFLKKDMEDFIQIIEKIIFNNMKMKK